jgi:hypothetical protein
VPRIRSPSSYSFPLRSLENGSHRNFLCGKRRPEEALQVLDRADLRKNPRNIHHMVAMATFGIVAGILGILDVTIRAFGQVKSAVHASKELGDSVDRILNLCQDVKTIV